jgi:hypothetical protein
MIALLAAGACALALLAVAPQATASTLYACVKKNGSARLFTSRPRCRHGEKRLAWNVEGPRGPQGSRGKEGRGGKNGPGGVNGTNGANGAAGGFSASNEALRAFTGAAGVAIVSKALPAGSYLVFAKTVVLASATTPHSYGANCELFDGTTLDSSQLLAPLLEVHASAFSAIDTLSLMAAVTLKSPAAVTLRCSDVSPDETMPIEAGDAQLVAVQTAQNS